MITPDTAMRLARQLLGELPTPAQEQVVRSVWTHRRTVVKAGTGVGKTRVAALCVILWLLSGPGRIAVTTAPTARQVRLLLWGEIRSILSSCRRRGIELGEVMPVACEWSIEGNRATGFSSDVEVNYQGFHSPGGTLFVLDEAPGVSPAIWSAIDATLTGSADRLLAIGNPTEPAGPFYEEFRSSSSSKITISSLESPNVVAGADVYPGMIGRDWLDERRREWGEGSDLWAARVLGQFPSGASDGLVPISWIDLAVARGKS